MTSHGSPRAVVIPFGVPASGSGLGVGLAALLHSCSQIHGEQIALAQLFARPSEGSPSKSPTPAETHLLPRAWRDLVASGNAPPNVPVVVTGAFEPPGDGPGLIHLVAFDGTSGDLRARVEAHLDARSAGATIVEAFKELCGSVDGDIGSLHEIGELGWDSLESVLRAERCVLVDPVRGGPHDRLAAMAHLGRAIGDSPGARFPAGRLAALAMDIAAGSHASARLTEAALRALTRATEDAPGQADLLEATAALYGYLGNPGEAEARALEALGASPDRRRLYAVLSESRRVRGDLDGALAALDCGMARPPQKNDRARVNEAILLTERGLVLTARGEPEAAEQAWREAMTRDPSQPTAFMHLAAMAVARENANAATSLIDGALAARSAHPEVMRRAIALAMTAESEGLARAARIAALARKLMDRVPGDAWGALMLGRALAQLGDREEAIQYLTHAEKCAPASALAAEAVRGRFALEEPQASMELDAVMRAVFQVPVADLPWITARARRLADTYDLWLPHFALGIAARRRKAWGAARKSFEVACARAPGFAPVHAELAGVCRALEDLPAALTHAELALALEPTNEAHAALVATIRATLALPPVPPSTFDRVSAFFRKRRSA